MSLFKAGVAMADITPRLPIALSGQYYARTAHEVYTPLKAAVLALEGENPVIFAICDLLSIPTRLVQEVRTAVAAKHTEIPVDAIILGATHIHTGPFLYNDVLSVFWGDDFLLEPGPGETQPEEYTAFLVDVLSNAIVEAWDSRASARLRSGSDYCAVSFSRRTVYENGTAKMYGSTARPDFKKMEGATDTGIHFMGIYKESGELLCAVMNVPCPAQVLEHKNYISADYWAEVRSMVQSKYGKEVVVLPFLGAAGDLSPRDLVRLAGDEYDLYSTPMYNEEGTRMIASKIMQCFDAFMENGSPYEKQPTVRHSTATPELPVWMAGEVEAAQAKTAYDLLRSKHESIHDFTEEECMMISLYMGLMNRFERQKTHPVHGTEIHCVQIGETVVATNPFELYVEFADRIRAGSPVRQTMILQLACGSDGYLPTDDAVSHGGYSAFIANGVLGPEGGTHLVKETLRLMNFPKNERVGLR